jgi:hypothetical protein
MTSRPSGIQSLYNEQLRTEACTQRHQCSAAVRQQLTLNCAILLADTLGGFYD